MGCGSDFSLYVFHICTLYANIMITTANKPSRTLLSSGCVITRLSVGCRTLGGNHPAPGHVPNHSCTFIYWILAVTLGVAPAAYDAVTVPCQGFHQNRSISMGSSHARLSPGPISSRKPGRQLVFVALEIESGLPSGPRPGGGRSQISFARQAASNRIKFS